MAGVYIGSTEITKAEIGTTDVTAIYLGTEKVWPPFVPVSVFDTFLAASVSNYTKVGGAMQFNGSAGVGDTNDGVRTLIRSAAPTELAGDDVYMKAVMGTNGNGVTSLVCRLSSDWTRFVKVHFIGGTCYIQRCTAGGAVSDINTGGTALITTANTIVEVIATASDNRYILKRNGTTIFNGIDATPAAMGPGYRGFGMMFERVPFANPPRLNEMTWADYTGQ